MIKDNPDNPSGNENIDDEILKPFFDVVDTIYNFITVNKDLITSVANHIREEEKRRLFINNLYLKKYTLGLTYFENKNLEQLKNK